MFRRLLAFTLGLGGLFGCDGSDRGVAPDAVGPDAGAPDASVPRACRQFGELTRDPQPFRTSSGLPIHPTNLVADPHVLYEDGRYRMWFTSVDWTTGTVFDATDRRMGTAYAESVDGTVWDDRYSRPTMSGHKIELLLKPGTWDSEGVETISVARTRADQLIAYHTGDRSNGTHAIGRARSTDGLVWQRDAQPVLVPAADWEQPLCIDPPACAQRLGGVLEPSFVVDPKTGTHHVWYAGFGLRGGDLSMQIGHAWSADGEQWQRAPSPVFQPGAQGTWDEILVSHTNVVTDPSGTGFHMFYQGISRAQQDLCAVEGSCPNYTPGSIGHAFSTDGNTWTRDPEPILVPTGADGFFVGGPSAVIRDGRLELFYFGIASRTDSLELRARLARATAACL